ncbi:MAG: NADPH-dependent FMN reductase [Fusobacteria bacterium]|nr:MAG: NADPH-dependent FMN reductase [Fusobacteriota bacterium]KAF0228622.1 MAG: NADPH-dependent FMN [Fusobacteriota bacterium]
MVAKKSLILGISGSPRVSVTSKALDSALKAAESVPGITTMKIDLAGHDISNCKNCNVCINKNLDFCPVFKDDLKKEYYEMYKNCDGIILATPIYHMTATGLIQNFLSRMKPLSQYARQGKFGSRMGAGIAVGGMRNGGQDFCLTVLNNMLQSSGVNIIGGGVQFYNGAAVWSKNQKELNDENGILETQALGRKLAYMCKVVQSGIDTLGEDINDANFLGFHNDEDLKQGYLNRGLDY